MLILLPNSSEIVEPVTLVEAKAHLRVFHSSDDALISGQIAAARQYAENFTGRALVIASWRQTLDWFCTPIRPALWPVSEIDAITYLDSDGVRQALDASAYAFDGDRNTIRPTGSWPTGSEVNVDFSTNPQDVPAAIKAAMLLVMADLYENAEAHITGTIVAANPAVMSLLWPYRLGLGA